MKPANDDRLQNVYRSGGTQLDLLETMLEQLTERFDIATPRDSAAIARQIQAVLDQIRDIKAENSPKTDELDDFLENLTL